MAVLSVLQRICCVRKLPINSIILRLPQSNVKPPALSLRLMSGGHGHTMAVVPSSFLKKKFYDALHFYLFITIMPLTVMTFLINIYIGPAELAETPADYEPKQWEYYQHPITRFISQYLLPSEQQEYEKTLHYLSEEHQRVYWRKTEEKMKSLIRERGDYKSWYYKPFTAKYERTKVVFEQENADKFAGLTDPITQDP